MKQFIILSSLIIVSINVNAQYPTLKQARENNIKSIKLDKNIISIFFHKKSKTIEKEIELNCYTINQYCYNNLDSLEQYITSRYQLNEEIQTFSVFNDTMFYTYKNNLLDKILFGNQIDSSYIQHYYNNENQLLRKEFYITNTDFFTEQKSLDKQDYRTVHYEYKDKKLVSKINGDNYHQFFYNDKGQLLQYIIDYGYTNSSFAFSDFKIISKSIYSYNQEGKITSTTEFNINEYSNKRDTVMKIYSKFYYKNNILRKKIETIYSSKNKKQLVFVGKDMFEFNNLGLLIKNKTYNYYRNSNSLKGKNKSRKRIFPKISIHKWKYEYYP